MKEDYSVVQGIFITVKPGTLILIIGLTVHKIPFFIWRRYLEPGGMGSQALLKMVSTPNT